MLLFRLKRYIKCHAKRKSTYNAQLDVLYINTIKTGISNDSVYLVEEELEVKIINYETAVAIGCTLTGDKYYAPHKINDLSIVVRKYSNNEYGVLIIYNDNFMEFIVYRNGKIILIEYLIKTNLGAIYSIKYTHGKVLKMRSTLPIKCPVKCNKEHYFDCSYNILDEPYPWKMYILNHYSDTHILMDKDQSRQKIEQYIIGENGDFDDYHYYVKN